MKQQLLSDVVVAMAHIIHFQSIKVLPAHTDSSRPSGDALVTQLLPLPDHLQPITVCEQCGHNQCSLIYRDEDEHAKPSIRENTVNRRGMKKEKGVGEREEQRE